MKKYIPVWLCNLLDCFSFKSSIPFITFFLGILSAYIGFSDIKFISSSIKEVSLWLSNTLIIGAIVGFMSSYAQARGIYKKDLESVIYDRKFLSIRNDLFKFWKNITAIFFEKNFPEISEDLMEIILRHYLPYNAKENDNKGNSSIEYYCENFLDKNTIEWYNEEHRTIKVTTVSTFDLKTISSNSITDFPYKVSISLEGNYPEDYKVEMVDYIIDGNKYTEDSEEFGLHIISNGPNIDVNKDLITEYHVKLNGKNEYSVKRILEKTYCIDNDYFIGFKAKSIIKNLRVQFFNNISEKLDLCFIPRGTLNNFKTNEDRAFFLENEYKGLILQNQGYIVILKLKTV